MFISVQCNWSVHTVVLTKALYTAVHIYNGELYTYVYISLIDCNSDTTKKIVHLSQYYDWPQKQNCIH